MCIDQQNPVERLSHVRLMGDVYATAEKVLGWLGPEDLDSKAAMTLTEELVPKGEELMKKEGVKLNAFPYSFTDPQVYDVIGIEKVSRDIWEGLGAFLKRRWFCPVLTFQEALLAKEIDVFCDPTKISWKRLEDFVVFWT